MEDNKTEDNKVVLMKFLIGLIHLLKQIWWFSLQGLS